jgi:acyl-CoA dehydrogenase
MIDVALGRDDVGSRCRADRSEETLVMRGLNAHFTSFFAVELHEKPSSTPVQMEHWLRMIAKPVVDADRYTRVWQEQVMPLGDRYAMNP